MRTCSQRPGLAGFMPTCTAPSISPTTIFAGCWIGRCRDCRQLEPLIESQLMDSLESPAGPAAPVPVVGTQRPSRIWKFWGTCLWGLFIFAALFVGQVAVVAVFVLQREG